MKLTSSSNFLVDIILFTSNQFQAITPAGTSSQMKLKLGSDIIITIMFPFFWGGGGASSRLVFDTKLGISP